MSVFKFAMLGGLISGTLAATIYCFINDFSLSVWLSGVCGTFAGTICAAVIIKVVESLGRGGKSNG